jgi:hypothetical protein
VLEGYYIPEGVPDELPEDRRRRSRLFRLRVWFYHRYYELRTGRSATAEPDWLRRVVEAKIIRISRRFMSDKISGDRIEDWIDVYEDRTTGWFLDHAWTLSQFTNTNFVVFYLALGYFEGWAQYRWGVDSDGRSQEFFRRALADVFRMEGPAGDAVAEVFYKQARCGVLHDAHLHRDIIFDRALPYPMLAHIHKETGRAGYILINPRRFVAALGQHFRKYVAALRDPANVELRENFAKTWRRLHNIGDVPASEMAPVNKPDLRPS